MGLQIVVIDPQSGFDVGEWDCTRYAGDRELWEHIRLEWVAVEAHPSEVYGGEA